MTTPLLWALTGERRAGKTTFCRLLVKLARAANRDVAGLLSPAIVENGLQTGILAEDIRTGESRHLASVSRQSPEDIPYGKWYFDPHTLAWGNRVLTNSPPCDLLIIDELGPLELTYRMGWQKALEILPQGGYKVGLAVIRPELLEAACGLFNIYEVIQIGIIHQSSV